MDEPQVPPSPVSRRDQDIALEMMKFIAVTTGYGKSGSPGAGFKPAAETKADEYAHHLLDLYAQCLAAVQGKRP